MPARTDVVIVGAGLYGCVLAERLANDLNKEVLIVEKRDHIGGNCYSTHDSATQIEYHAYGSHIFHTSLPHVWEYISRFTAFNNYRHQVLTCHQDKLFQLPINLETINSFYGKNLRPFEAKAWLAGEIARSSAGAVPQNLEEQAIAAIGRPLYEAFIKGYTMKQWGMDPRRLPKSIINRLPVRFNYNEDYFHNSRWQGIPLEGYTRMFERMLESPGIHIELETDFFAARERYAACPIIYTGPIDRFYGYKFGALVWRSLYFEKEVRPYADYQGNAVINYADSAVPYTRSHEPKHLHPERPIFESDMTLTLKEYPCDDPENPYYPVRTPETMQRLRRYKAEVEKEKNVFFGGRLAEYAYYDMDMTISAALKAYGALKKLWVE